MATRRAPLRSGRTASVALLALAAGAFAQTTPDAPDLPVVKHVEEIRQHRVGTYDLLAPAPAGELGRDAIEALGESPIAALLAGLGEDVQLYTTHVITLSNPFFEGRAPGLEGNRRAAAYIEHYFRTAGLEPAFASETTAADGTSVLTPGASYRQPFEAGREIRLGRHSVAIGRGGAGEQILTEGRDYSVPGFSATAAVEGPLVFVGYSIADAERDYSSYPQDASLEGKIAVMLRFEPMDEQGQSRWAEEGWSPASALATKLNAAVKRGAAAILLANPPGADDPRADELMGTSTSTWGTPTMPVPVIHLSAEAADALVRGADAQGRSLMELRTLADREGGVFDLPKARVSIDVEVVREPVLTDNVGGVLPGRGELADEYIVIGAHYDHVGFGPGGASPEHIGTLHPGADDNASGTSGLLLLADALSGAYEQLPADADARSIMFLAFSAEERGLIGSRHFVAHPPVPTSKMYLMLNMDMIGRLRSGQIDIEGTDSAEGMLDWVQPLFDASGLTIATTSRLGGRSDHASFYRAGVPVLMFFTGFHNEYHKPSDTGWLINQTGAVQVARLVGNIALAAAQRPEPLKFAGTVREGRGRRGQQREAASGAAGENPPMAPAGGRIRFGIAPGDYAEGEKGVLVGEVYENTPAAEAGLKTGDRIIKWNGHDLPDVNAWMPLLRQHKPGDVVEFVVVREGKQIPMKATLRARAPEPR